MKKKVLGISAVFVLSALLWACSNKQDKEYNEGLDEYLISKSIEFTCMMDSLAQDTEYISLVTPNPDITEFITEIGSYEYIAPNKAVLIKIPDMILESILKDTVGEFDFAEDVHELVMARSASSVPNMINAQKGADKIAVSSILNVSKPFQQYQDFTGSIYVVLLYDQYSSATFFRNTDEGITTAASSFLFLNDDLKNTLEEETLFDQLSQLLNAAGIKTNYLDEIEVVYIDGEKIAEYK